MSVKSVLRNVTPPVLWGLASRLKRHPMPKQWVQSAFAGPYPSWLEAEAASDGWASPMVLEKTLGASLSLRDGKIEFQQDTMIFPKIIYSPLILALLALSLQRDRERLFIFDIGGSLGTNFFQNRKLLDALGGVSVSWNVVEIPPTVEIGRKHFATPSLNFFDSINDARGAMPGVPQAVLFSGSLQYVRDYLNIVDQAIDTGAPFIAMDRLLTSPTVEHAIYIQQPSPEFYYAATYPVHCFSLSCFLREMKQKRLHLIEHFTQNPGTYFDHCGMLFERIP